MPEGDTVFKLAGYLRRELRGRELVTGSVRSSQPVDLAGRRVVGVSSHGKHLFIEFDNGLQLRSHLGMWGSWHGYAPMEQWQKPRRQAAIVLDIGERVFVCFNPLQVEVLRPTGVRRRRLGVALGPDLLAPEPDLDTILIRVRTLTVEDAPIVDVLLDQRIASGIGNVYKSEVLFLGGLDPRETIGSLGDGKILDLYRRASDLLGRNLSGGPRVTRRAGDAAGPLWVYGRTGQPCLKCDDLIRSSRLGRGQRSTFWCPTCQLRTPA